MKNHFYSITSKTVQLIDNTIAKAIPKELKRTKLFLEWKEKHLHYFEEESKDFDIDLNMLPAYMEESYYLNLKDNMKRIIDKYYYIDHTTAKRFLDKRKTIDEIDQSALLYGLILVKGNVVWMDFGFNVGCEFGGYHPALIMRRVGENILVLPIDTVKETYYHDARKHIVFDTILGNYTLKKRYIDVERLSRVSIYRINRPSILGRLKFELVKEVEQKLANYWKVT